VACRDTTATPTATTARSPAPTITDLTDTVRSQRAIAVVCGPTVTFLDPASGAERETIRPSVRVRADRVVLVDAGEDTLVVFLYEVSHPQDGLTPAWFERRVQVHSRRSGRQTMDRAVVLPGDTDARGGWGGAAVVGVDPSGYIALNIYLGRDRDLAYVLSVRSGRDDWSRTQDHPSLTDPSISALAVHRGVVLMSRVTEDSAGLQGYDVGTGRLLWQRRFGIESLTVPDHPACAVGRGDTFVVMGRWVPLVVDARTGRSRAQVTNRRCMKIDPVGSTGAYGGVGRGGAVVAVNLTNGERRWAIETERVEALRLELVSVYDDRVYVTTRDASGRTIRLALDAGTGREIARDWTLAPVERHDGWVVAYDPDRDADVVIRA
jgi:hypothetical protein